MQPAGPTSKDEKIYIVYLTGFGPFSRIEDNPSSQITLSFLPPLSTVIELTAPSGTPCKIRLLPHPNAVRVAYAEVDALIPTLWKNRDSEWQYILHVGVGCPGSYKVETAAHEKGYIKKDVDGRVANGEDEELAIDDQGNDSKPIGRGEVFTTALDVGYLTEFVRSQAKTPSEEHTIDILPSSDAGMYLCEYIFRASLMEAAKRGARDLKRALFLHVPPEDNPYSISLGRAVVEALVTAMVLDGEGLREPS